jgi:hypothetical protein
MMGGWWWRRKRKSRRCTVWLWPNVGEGELFGGEYVSNGRGGLCAFGVAD